MVGQTKYRGKTLRLRRDFIPVAKSALVQCHSDPKPHLAVFSGNWFGLGQDLYHELLAWLPMQQLDDTGVSPVSGSAQAGVSAVRHVLNQTRDWQTLAPSVGRIVPGNTYQHAWSTKSAEQNRELVARHKGFWTAFDKLLSATPWRSSLVVSGDDNCVLKPRRHVAAWGIHLGNQQAEVVQDRTMLLNILEGHRLCGLNT